MPKTLTRRVFLQKLGLAALTAPVVAVAASVYPEATGVAAQALKAPVGPLTASQVTSDQWANLHKRGLISKADFQKEFGLTDEKPLTKSTYVGDISPTYIEAPKIYVFPQQQPTKYDPLGAFGGVAYKFFWNGQSYGDWIKIDDVPGLYASDKLSETLKLLKEHAELKLTKLDPHARFTPETDHVFWNGGHLNFTQPNFLVNQKWYVGSEVDHDNTNTAI